MLSSNVSEVSAMLSVPAVLGPFEEGPLRTEKAELERTGSRTKNPRHIV